MSRSRKKPILKDSNKGMKRHSHKLFRKKVKQKIQENRLDEIPEDQREVTNQYDVSDWKFYAEEGDDFYEKFKRK